MSNIYAVRTDTAIGGETKMKRDFNFESPTPKQQPKTLLSSKIAKER